MIEPNANRSSPWWVMVTRQGPHTKGTKFYSGASTKNVAESIAAERNAVEAAKPQGARTLYFYSVIKKP